MNMENEIWKPIKGFENIYEVSNLGRVKSLARSIKAMYGKATHYSEQKVKERILKPSFSTYGYAYVAEPLLDNPDNLPSVNHKDENPRNDTVENLEWCTYTYNNTYKNIHLRRKKTNRRIIQYDLDMHELKRWDSIIEAAKFYNIETTNISSCCTGKRNHCAGFKWRYYE